MPSLMSVFFVALALDTGVSELVDYTCENSVNIFKISPKLSNQGKWQNLVQTYHMQTGTGSEAQ